MKDESDKGFDWSTMARIVEVHGRDPVNAHSGALHGSMMARLNDLEDAVFPVNFHFKLNNRSHTVSLRFRSSVPAPRRDEPILLTFQNDEDGGKKYRVSSFADYTIHEYYDNRILNNIDKDGVILNVYLKPVTIQPLDEEIEAEYREAYAEVPSREEYRQKVLAEAVTGKKLES